MSYVKPKLPVKEAQSVLGLLKRWHGSEPERDRAERKLEIALASTITSSGQFNRRIPS